jgi:hypothetical protein
MRRKVTQCEGREGHGFSCAAERHFDLGFSRCGSRSRSCAPFVKRVKVASAIFDFRRTRAATSGAKARASLALYGTTEVVPFPNLPADQAFFKSSHLFQQAKSFLTRYENSNYGEHND